MMYMDDDFLESYDLDWFSSYEDGFLAHFTTGGGSIVPKKVRESIESYELIYDYFYSLSASTDIEIIESNLPTFSAQGQRERYLQSFSNMAARGLCSYDISRDGSGYKLIAKPKSQLKYEHLPEEIKRIIYILPAGIISNATVLEKVE